MGVCVCTCGVSEAQFAQGCKVLCFGARFGVGVKLWGNKRSGGQQIDGLESGRVAFGRVRTYV